MKSLIVLVVGLLAVGCRTPEHKQKDLRDSVVGEYEYKREDGVTTKLVFLENGIREVYVSSPRLNINGRKQKDAKWSVVKEEIHVKDDSGFIWVYRINKDKSITAIARIVDGKRTDVPIEDHRTYKRIKLTICPSNT
jgi:hypothetical protein